jgi:hypothetical protein
MENPVADIEEELLIPPVSIFGGRPFGSLDGNHHIPQKRNLRLGEKFSLHLSKGQDIGDLIFPQEFMVKPPELGVIHQHERETDPFPAQGLEDLFGPSDDLSAGEEKSFLTVFDRNLETGTKHFPD